MACAEEEERDKAEAAAKAEKAKKEKQKTKKAKQKVPSCCTYFFPNPQSFSMNTATMHTYPLQGDPSAYKHPSVSSQHCTSFSVS